MQGRGKCTFLSKDCVAHFPIEPAPTGDLFLLPGLLPRPLAHHKPLMTHAKKGILDKGLVELYLDAALKEAQRMAPEIPASFWKWVTAKPTRRKSVLAMQSQGRAAEECHDAISKP